MTSLFIDSDILLDAVLLREPHHIHAFELLALADTDRHSLYTSAHSLLNVYYFASKESGKKAAGRSILLLEEKLKILSTHGSAIKQALLSDFSDIEDAVQYELAIESKCDVIITRNLKDYRGSNLPVMTTEQYLQANK